MNYTIITKQIKDYKSKNQFEDIYIYSFIKLNSDFKTGVSIITEKILADKIKVPERTIKSIIGRLKKYPDLIRIEQKPIKEHIEKGEYYFLKNFYSFNLKPENYFILDNSFFYLDIPIKIKGFLLKLKSVCKNDTNKYISDKPYKGGINKADLARKLNIDKDTLNNYLNDCLALKQIRYIDNGLLITNKCFLLSVSENKENEIYNTIYDFCLDKGCVPPERNKDAIMRIMLLNNPEPLKNILENKCKTLPENVSFEYFLKVLSIKKTEIKQPNFQIIL
ncbi:MAG: hypothetical protein H6Q15_2276 [Bacteroidetes bacterium]|nr:hypothetical protein [Bacteroidota bacterium]